MEELRVDPASWPEAIAVADGHQIVVGGPGTGKTEFLVRRAAHLIDQGVPADDLLLLSFSRRGVADLRDRLTARLGRTVTGIPAMTFHAFASRLHELHGLGDERSLLTSPEQVEVVRELLASEDPARWPVPFRPLLTTQTFAEEVTDFLLRCSEHLVDPETLASFGRDDWRGLPEFLIRYRDHLAEIERIDYGTLLTSAISLLDTTPQPYRYVLVDEYQDTTRAQAELVDRLASVGNLTAAADPYQSIYSFRGADVRNVARFVDSRPEVRRLVLTTSFRVPKQILGAAERLTRGGDLPGAAGPVVPAPGEGSVEVYGFAQLTEEAEWIAREAQRLHLQEGVPYAAMAVFVRSKRRFLSELSRVLERRRIPHDLPDARLADQPAVRVVFDLVAAATEPPAERDRAIRRILLGPLFHLPLSALREVERERLRLEVSWPEVIRSSVPDGGPLAQLLDDPSWAVTMSAADGFWRIWTTLPQVAHLVRDPRRLEERAAWASLAQVLGRIVERDRTMTLTDYRRLADSEDFEATPLLSFRPSGDTLTLTTMHQSKGLQFDVVFIADAVEGVFPDLRTRDSLLGVRHLTRSVPTDNPGYLRFRLQEEMRLAYTAMTRASRRAVWTATSTGFDEGTGMPSRFLAAIAGVDTVEAAIDRPAVDPMPVTRLEAEAWLRRLLTDPSQPAPRRVAAAALLAEGTRWGLRPWTRFAGVLPRGPDTGLVSDGVRLSPSRAEGYLTCPRRFALERLLHIGEEPSVYASIGTVVHETLEAAEQKAMERGAVHADLDDALQVLATMWDPSLFGGEPWAGSWRRRAEEILEHLYTHWPSACRPIALERWLELDIDGIRWVGKADRIERCPDGIKIVDYKTSRSSLSVGDAAVSVQLGFYAMAADADPDLPGPVAGAELWYPANTKAKSVTTRRLDLSRLGDVQTAMREAASGIVREDWTARPNRYCSTCRVRLVCPAWPDGKEAFVS